MNHRFISPALAAVVMVVCFAGCSKSNTDTASTPAAQPTPAAAAASTAPAGDATYTFSISPAWKTGMKFGYVGDDQAASPDGKTSIHFEADGEVLAMLPSGTPQKLALTVKALHVTGADLPPESLPGPGSKVVIEYPPNGKRRITFNDKLASGDATQCLDAVLLITLRNHTDQDVFGPSGPVAVGANWPVNAKAFTDFNEEGEQHFTSMEGSLNLQGIEGEGESRVAAVSGVLMSKGQNPPDDPGTFVMLLNFSAWVPLGPTGVFKETMVTNTTITPSGAAALFASKPETDVETVTQEVTVR